MRILLDTQVFLWYVTAHSSLPVAMSTAIKDSDNEVLLSGASVWEATIKYARGNLPLPEPAHSYLPRLRQQHGIRSLPIDEGAFGYLAQLPLLHRDPFDRLLIAQAVQHDLWLAAIDTAIRAYPVKLLPMK